ncbi:MAG: hypothetical protein WAL40_12435, partial [Rhodoplanes sp.]
MLEQRVTNRSTIVAAQKLFYLESERFERTQDLVGMALLEIKDLHVMVGDRPILNGLDLVVNKGEVHAIMGPNGS